MVDALYSEVSGFITGVFPGHIDWTVYGKEAETIVKPGMLDVRMDYQEQGKKVTNLK